MGAKRTQIRQAIGILDKCDDKRIVNNNIIAFLEAGCITDWLTRAIFLPISGIAKCPRCKAIANQRHREIS